MQILGVFFALLSIVMLFLSVTFFIDCIINKNGHKRFVLRLMLFSLFMMFVATQALSQGGGAWVVAFLLLGIFLYKIVDNPEYEVIVHERQMAKLNKRVNRNRRIRELNELHGSHESPELFELVDLHEPFKPNEQKEDMKATSDNSSAPQVQSFVMQKSDTFTPFFVKKRAYDLLESKFKHSFFENRRLKREVRSLKKFIKSKDISSLPSIDEYEEKLKKYRQALINLSEYYEQCIDSEVDRELSMIDSMDGFKFEEYCANLILSNGAKDVVRTPATGDNGIDIICHTGNESLGIQCKNYSKPVGNKAVQEVFSGKSIYSLDRAIVLTNSTYTRSAIDSGDKLNVTLWDREYLKILIRNHFTTAKIAAKNKSTTSVEELCSTNTSLETSEIEPLDELFQEAKKIVINQQQASVSLLQRKLRVEYNRASGLIDELEAHNIISPIRSDKSRSVLVPK